MYCNGPIGTTELERLKVLHALFLRNSTVYVSYIYVCVCAVNVQWYSTIYIRIYSMYYKLKLLSIVSIGVLVMRQHTVVLVGD